MANVWAEISANYIDSVTTRRVASEATRDNIFQGILLKDGEAVTEAFSKDTDASEIQVLRVKPLANDAREIGASTNGGWFNNEDAQTSSTEAYGIQILQVIDRNIDIPANEDNMVSVPLLQKETQNLGGLVNRNINAATIAAMIAKNFNNIAGYDQRNSNASATTLSTAVTSNWVTLSTTYTDAVIDAGAALDAGNSDQGIDAYPMEQRALIIRPAMRAALTKAMTGLYGGIGVYDVLGNAGVDRTTKPAVSTTGLVGYIAGMPVYVASNIVWTLAESYLGLSSGALSTLMGIACSGVGTGRALAFNSTIKTIDAPSGQGLRLQPKYRFGVECWDALSVVPIFSASFTNPVTASTNTLYVRGVGSRS